MTSPTDSLSIPPTAPAGGLTVVQPPQTATSYFKIATNQPITFSWSFFSLLATPTHLTVSAVCDNGNTYPVGPSNGVIDGTATQVVWDLDAYQSEHPELPLAQATYTLNIWDDRGPGQPIKGGFLQQNNALHFAMYTPQPYTGLADGKLFKSVTGPLLKNDVAFYRWPGWSCTGCSGAMTYAAHPAFISLVVTFFIIFFSGFHLLRTSAR